jgi:hypothetical protein
MRQESALYAMSTDGTGRRLVLDEPLLSVERKGGNLTVTSENGNKMEVRGSHSHGLPSDMCKGWQ